MDCQQFLARYSDLLDELMGPAQRAAMMAHLEACAACARYDRVMRQGLALAAELPAPDVPDDLTARIHGRLAELDEELASARGLAGPGAAASLAVAVLLAAIVWSPLLRRDLTAINLAAGEAAELGVEASPDAVADGDSPSPEGDAPAATGLASADLAGAAYLPAASPQSAWTWPVANAASAFSVPVTVVSATLLFGPELNLPGPHSPLIVMEPAYGRRARARPAEGEARRASGIE